ncbi:hypothetical protein HYW76_02120 [Candidatus Pacearchaeota archaeon]|nr:hypothetical protein [Candidatus Pacearchaeota archaeon]
MAKHKLRIADSEGKIISPGSWTDEEFNREAEKILREANFVETSVEQKCRSVPYSSAGLVEQYEFFRNKIYEPKRVFYPCSNLDISPIAGFPNSEVVLMDRNNEVGEAMRREGVRQFIQADVLTYTPETPFDLVIILDPELRSKDLVKHLVTGGYAIANNWHNNASQLLKDSRFKGIGTIDRDERRIYLAEDFSKIEPRQFLNYFYVFKRLR